MHENMSDSVLKTYAWAMAGIIFLLLHGSAAAADSTFRVASVLQSRMVVQQGKPFTVWGKSMPGSLVQVQTSWHQEGRSITARDSTWQLKVKVPRARRGDFTQHRITITTGKDTIILSDILIGEVWLCSGQSNMDMSMQPFLPWHHGVTNYAEEIAAATYPHIRLFRVTKETSSVERDTLNGQWRECLPENVNDFSGVAYYFGRRLFRELNIPIGLVQSAYGSAACQAFIRRKVLEADTVLKREYLDPYDANPQDKMPVLRPMLIYNAMIHPLVKLSLRGFLWYQGESNAGEIKLYPRLNEALIRSWREEFGQGDLPFYFVQMTPHDWQKSDPAENAYACFREAQEKVLAVKNTGMVCTMDVGEPANIHPNNKKPVGERLAGLALFHDYGQRSTVSRGPVYKSLKVKGDIVKVIFEKASLSGGLRTHNGEAPRHFFVAGRDKVFYPARATIAGDAILLSSPQVNRPVAVRYAFTNYPVTNLENGAGLPAYPFRSDNWEDEKVIILSNDKQNP